MLLCRPTSGPRWWISVAADAKTVAVKQHVCANGRYKNVVAICIDPLANGSTSNRTELTPRL